MTSNFGRKIFSVWRIGGDVEIFLLDDGNLMIEVDIAQEMELPALRNLVVRLAAICDEIESKSWKADEWGFHVNESYTCFDGYKSHEAAEGGVALMVATGVNRQNIVGPYPIRNGVVDEEFGR